MARGPRVLIGWSLPLGFGLGGFLLLLNGVRGLMFNSSSSAARRLMNVFSIRQTRLNKRAIILRRRTLSVCFVNSRKDQRKCVGFRGDARPKRERFNPALSVTAVLTAEARDLRLTAPPTALIPFALVIRDLDGESWGQSHGRHNARALGELRMQILLDRCPLLLQGPAARIDTCNV